MGYDLRPMSDPGDDPVLSELRQAIATADRELLAAFTRRLEAAAEIKRYKDERGYASFDPERERELLAAWRGANASVISDGVLRELFETVLELSKREIGHGKRR
jgi:chorismate mutase